MTSKLLKTGRRLLAILISVLLLALVIWMSGAANVIQGLSRFSPSAVSGILLLLLANLFLVSFRLWRILGHYGIPLPWRIASRASVSGHVAGLFVMSLFGQVLGRQAVLRHHGVRPVVIASLAAYERVVLTFISAMMCLLGAGFLLGQSAIGEFLGQLSLVEVVLASVGGIALSLMFGYSRFEVRLAQRIRSWSVFGYLLEISGITLLSQLLMLLSFVIGILAFQPDMALIPAIAAAAVISFAASMPITVNGWGVREVAAVYVLGKLGMSGADAVAISVMVGICATVVVLVPAAFSSHRPMDEKVRVNENAFIDQPGQEIEKTGAWVLAIATSVLVFFQVHAELPGMWGVLNFNFADPFAILALAGVALHAVSSHHVPRWRLGQFNLVLVVFSLLLLMAFLRGVLDIGVTQWALGGRLFGWIVLLGYVSAGYLMVAHAGILGLRRLSETMVAAGVVVVVVSVFLRLLNYAGCGDCGHVTQNFEGYAGNRNAFAFQMLICLALILAYSSARAKPCAGTLFPRLRSPLSSHGWAGGAEFCVSGRRRFRDSALPLGTILCGLFLSASRAGWLTAAVMLFIAGVIRLADRRFIVRGTVLAACLLVVYMMVAEMAVPNFPISNTEVKTTLGISLSPLIPSTHATNSSDQERLDSIARGLDLWRQSPWIGAGLGVFIEKSTGWFDHPVVIHSTPVWILTEFGIIGLLGFGWGFLVLLRYAATMRKTIPMRRILGLLLLLFAIFSLVHEVFYQRIFWLVLGAAMASPGRNAVTGRSR